MAAISIIMIALLSLLLALYVNLLKRNETNQQSSTE
jgi:hypothetical protein